MNKDIQESPRERRKREIQQKLLWGALSVLGLVILSVAIIACCCGGLLKKSETERTLTNALRFKTGNTQGLKVLEISEPDSVFFNRVCPEEELMELSESFLRYSMSMMQESQKGLTEDGNDAYRCRMDRYSATSASLNSLNGMLDKPCGRHCGWRIKAKYQATDDSGTPYVAETWFIFDRRKKHILNSFDICIL